MVFENICRFEVSGDAWVGTLSESKLYGLSRSDADFREYLSRMELVSPQSAEAVFAHSDVAFLPPLCAGARIVCVGRNYASHASEMGSAPPANPNIFTRTHESLVGHGAALRMPAHSTHYDFEGELAIVIGRGGSDISEQDALDHVAGYTLLHDGSVRDYQQHSLFAGKNFDASGSCGPAIVSASAVDDPQNLAIETRVNGELMQSASTHDMIFPAAHLISYISKVCALQTGDIISTGTPEGVGAGRNPPIWLKPGDRLRVEIERIGALENIVST